MAPLTFRDFVKRYGDHTTSNHQLTKWANQLDIPNFHCVMRDEIKYNLYLPKPKGALNVIVNLEKADQQGSDWNAWYTKDDCSYYFSSYALPPLKEVRTFLNHNSDSITNRKYNTMKLQDFNQRCCGQISLYVLYRLNLMDKPTDEDFEDLILDMKQEETFQ